MLASKAASAGIIANFENNFDSIMPDSIGDSSIKRVFISLRTGWQPASNTMAAMAIKEMEASTIAILNTFRFIGIFHSIEKKSMGVDLLD